MKSFKNYHTKTLFNFMKSHIYYLFFFFFCLLAKKVMETKDTIYIVMEYIEYGSLKDLIKEK